VTYSSDLEGWYERAGRLKQAGAYRLDTAELVAVYNALFPGQPLSCETCRGVLLQAYQRILRALREHTSATTPLTTMDNQAARFKSDDTIYFPHGLGVAYSNANITDKMARYILAKDPEAAKYFEVLPGEEQPEAPASTLADVLTGAVHVPGYFTPAASHESHTGESEEDADDDSDEAKPMRLSRANQEQLRTYYREELGQEPAEDATNRELRQAIQAHRSLHATDSAE